MSDPLVGLHYELAGDYTARDFALTIVPQYGGVLDNINVYVYIHGTTTVAPIYSDADLLVSMTNPIVTSTGAVFFWVLDDATDYDIVLSGGNLAANYTISGIWPYDNTSYSVLVNTTNTAEWTPDIQEIIEEAYERVGVEIRTGYQFRTARRSLNILFQEWANRGINMWTIEEGSITLLYGQGTYDLPADTVDLIEFVIRQNSGSQSNQSDIIIPRIPMPTYAAIPNKLATGRPSQVYVNRQTPIPQINVWPTPNQSGYLFHYWRLRRIYDAVRPGIATLDLPFRFVPAIIAGLAYQLAIKTPEAMDRVSMLKQLYDEAFQLATNEDRDRSAVRFVPRMMRV